MVTISIKYCLFVMSADSHFQRVIDRDEIQDAPARVENREDARVKSARA